jgi:hypothetical protein
MRLTEEELKKLYQKQTARPAREREECLTEEELLRAAMGEMSPSERERFADHMISCSDCAQEYRLTQSLKPLAEQVTDGEAKISKAEAEVIAIRAFLPVRALYAIAASLLVLCIGLGIWAQSLRREKSLALAGLNEQLAERERTIAAQEEALAKAQRQLEEAPKQFGQYENQIAELRKDLAELNQPQINVLIADLDPANTIRGGSTGTAIVRVPPGANFFTLILNTTSEKSYPDYALEILDQRGKTLWQGSGLQKSSSNNFTVALPRALFPSGQYRIKLSGLSKSRKELVEDYLVKIQY